MGPGTVIAKRWHRAVGRLGDGVTLEQADREVATIFAGVRDENPEAVRDYGTLVVGLAENLSLDGDASGIVVKIEGRPVPEGSAYDGIRVHRQAVEPGYFETLGIERIAGRDFGPQDTDVYFPYRRARRRPRIGPASADGARVERRATAKLAAGARR